MQREACRQGYFAPNAVPKGRTGHTKTVCYVLKSRHVKQPMSSASSRRPAADRAQQEHCIFCRIARRQEPNVILHEDDRLVAFRDINPAAKEHLLVISKAHIPSLKNLSGNEEDIHLVEAMLVLGKALLACADPARVKFGFHYPPFNSVDHLHLHCFRLPHNFLGYKYVETTGAWAGYMTAEQLLSRLRMQQAAQAEQGGANVDLAAVAASEEQ